jgi:hypothetical protein
MVAVFMGNKNSFYPVHFQSQPAHPDFRFGAGKTGINEYGLFVIADIIAITIASGIQ